MLIESGPDTRRTPPARRWAFPFWTEPMRLLVVGGIVALAGGALMIGSGLRGRKR